MDYMVEQSTGLRAVRYKSIVVWIHWISALLVLLQVYLGFTFHDLPRGTAEREFFFSWHRTVGVTILILALVRLAVRLMNPPPPYPSDFPKWERFAAVWNHRLFYLLLVALPLTGLAAASGMSKDGWVHLQLGLKLPAIPGIPRDNEFHEVHEALVWVTIALLVLHVSAALYNQFASATNVADRMWPFKARRDS